MTELAVVTTAPGAASEASDRTAAAAPRVALICHADDRMNSELVQRWLRSFARVTGVVLIAEKPGTVWRRLRAEYRRVGLVRLIDVLLFRLYYLARLRAADDAWEREEIERRLRRLPPVPADASVLVTADPNSDATVKFLRAAAPDLMVARCKWLLRKEVYEIPARGTFVLHPGICPQYRNAHGCFWALANRDLTNVGLTLLRVDAGIDTGPVYGYFRYPFDERSESHIKIQHRAMLENLDAIKRVLLEVCAGRVEPIPVASTGSRAWGQPWLSAYLRWKRAAPGA
jgi:folate-dependent phosphoribosylglycinamide formyltransferase PurN